MKVTLWGTRGSVPRAGTETVRFGGDTSSVEVAAEDGTIIVLDAGSGVVRAGAQLKCQRVDILLSHLHMDHIQGLGFFRPLFDPNVECRIWGPGSTTMKLAERLSRYLSPPLFPVRLRDLPNLEVHDLDPEVFSVGPFTIAADLVCHPGPTLGYRISDGAGTIAYLPDHEPALGNAHFPGRAEWTSGYRLAAGVDVLIHDAQYTDAEYEARVGWGHSTFAHAIAFARLAAVKTLVTFHHDPEHSDAMLEGLTRQAAEHDELPFEMVPGTAGATFEVG